MHFKNLEHVSMPLEYADWLRMRKQSPHALTVLNNGLIKKPGAQIALFKQASQAAAAGIAFEWRVGSIYLHRLGNNLTALCPIYAGTPESVLAFGERGSLMNPSLATCLFRRHATRLASRFLAAFRHRHARLLNASWVAVHVRRGDKVALDGCNTTVAEVCRELQRQLGKERPPLAVFSEGSWPYRKSLGEALRATYRRVLMLDGEVHKLANGLGISPLDNQMLFGFVDTIVNSAPSTIELGYMRPGRTFCAPIIFHKSFEVTSRNGGTLTAAWQARIWPRMDRPKMTARFGRVSH